MLVGYNEDTNILIENIQKEYGTIYLITEREFMQEEQVEFAKKHVQICNYNIQTLNAKEGKQNKNLKRISKHVEKIIFMEDVAMHNYSVYISLIDIVDKPEEFDEQPNGRIQKMQKRKNGIAGCRAACTV